MKKLILSVFAGLFFILMASANAVVDVIHPTSIDAMASPDNELAYNAFVISDDMMAAEAKGVIGLPTPQHFKCCPKHDPTDTIDSDSSADFSEGYKDRPGWTAD